MLIGEHGNQSAFSVHVVSQYHVCPTMLLSEYVDEGEFNPDADGNNNNKIGKEERQQSIIKHQHQLFSKA